MARGELLFAKYDLSLVLLGQEQKIKEAVEKIPPDALLNSSQDELCDELEQEFNVNVPLLKEDAIETDQREATVDVSQDQQRIIFDRSQPFYMKGTEISFFVPYEGDGNLFEFKPNHFTLNPPRAHVDEGQLVLSYTRLDHDAEAVKREFQSDLASIL